MTLRTLPREGMLIPGFELPHSGGGTVRLRRYRGRRGLAVIFCHGPACAGCRDYLTGALEAYDGYGDADAEVIAVVPGPAEAVAELRRALALPFPVLVDADGVVCRRYGLIPGADAAALAADRYGEPRLWQVAGADHALPAHDAIVAELRYLSLTCSGGCSVPLWQDE
jgi:peroxiredoxin